MNKLIPHIQYLLREHDCLIVPGWGAFVVNHQEAMIEGEEIFPPKRIPGFNNDLVHNDGILVSSIVQRDGISYQQALTQVKEAVEMMDSILEITGSVAIPRVGKFFRAKDGKKLFEPDTDNNIANSSYYGLIPVTLQEEKPGIVIEEEENAPRFLPAIGRAVKWAAAIVVLFVLGVTLSTPVVFEKDNHYRASVISPNLEIPRPQPVVIPQPQEEEATMQGIVTENATEAQELPAADVEKWRMDRNDRYYLIVASFETNRQASNYINGRPDENLDILDYDGRYRVFAATGKTFADARKPLEDKEFSTIHPDGWVFKK